ncbi:MAG: alpha/beta fold hydrolase, partial [Saprospiraceae bacterium]
VIRYMKERKTNRERWVSPLTNKIIPMRMINGVQDPISGRHLAERFQEIVPDSDIVFLENAGHYPHVETPKEVLTAFFDFMDLL